MKRSDRGNYKDMEAEEKNCVMKRSGSNQRGNEEDEVVQVFFRQHGLKLCASAACCGYLYTPSTDRLLHW